MPLQELTVMEQRRQMVQQVREGEMSVTAAARTYGVSRTLVYRWLERDAAGESLVDRSRRPLTSPRLTEPALVQQVLNLKGIRPYWGAKKLHATLWPQREAAPLAVRTVDRILARAGLVTPRRRHAPSVGRFERATPNELWQLDFKGCPLDCPYHPCSVLDDHSRFCLALAPVPSQQLAPLWELLWATFGEFGLPEFILCDNASLFNSAGHPQPTQFQAWLWRLGVHTCHGRPRHPQTQGKVERFHGTLQLEQPEAMRQRDPARAATLLAAFRADYNHQRPHEALDMGRPAEHYQPSERLRPERLPEAALPLGAAVRKVDSSGKVSYHGQTYRAGRGLAGEAVEIQDDTMDPALYYHGIRIAGLSELAA